MTTTNKPEDIRVCRHHDALGHCDETPDYKVFIRGKRSGEQPTELLFCKPHFAIFCLEFYKEFKKMLEEKDQ